MKKQKSSTIVLSEFSSSDDESEKAMPKIDKEELRKYLQNSDDDEESQQNKTSPQKSKRVRHKIKTSQDKPKKVISKDTSQNYLVQGDDFKKLQKKAKKLGASSLDYSKRKNYKYIIDYDNKKIHFGSANTEDYPTHKDPVRREVFIKSQENFKQRWTTYSPNSLLSKLLGCQTFELEKKFKFKKIIFYIYNKRCNCQVLKISPKIISYFKQQRSIKYQTVK